MAQSFLYSSKFPKTCGMVRDKQATAFIKFTKLNLLNIKFNRKLVLSMSWMCLAKCIVKEQMC